MRFASKRLSLVAIVLGLLALLGKPSSGRADICSAYAAGAAYEEYWGNNRALAGRMMCSVPNVSPSTCQARGGDYKPDNGSGRTICFMPPPSASSSGSAAAPDTARQRCADLVSQYNEATDVRTPESIRYLQNAEIAFLGEVIEPAKACGDADVYRRIRRNTLRIKLAAAQQCRGVEDLRNDDGTRLTPEFVEAQIRREEDVITKKSADICRLAQEQLRHSPAVTLAPKPEQQLAAPSDFDMTMRNCLLTASEMGVVFSSVDDAVTRCGPQYLEAFANATLAQIDAAYAWAMKDPKVAAAQRKAAAAPKPAPAACVQLGQSTRQQCNDDPVGTRNCRCQTFNNLCSVPVTVHYTIVAPRGSRARDSAEGMPLDPVGKGKSHDSICTSYSGQTLTYTSWEQRAH